MDRRVEVDMNEIMAVVILLWLSPFIVAMGRAYVVTIQNRQRRVPVEVSKGAFYQKRSVSKNEGCNWR